MVHMMNIWVKKIMAITLVLATAALFAFASYDTEYKRYKKIVNANPDERLRVYECINNGFHFQNGVKLSDEDVKTVEKLLNSCVKSQNQDDIHPPIAPGVIGGGLNKNGDKNAKFIVMHTALIEHEFLGIVFYDFDEVIFTDESGFPNGRYTCSKRLYEKVILLIQKFAYDKANGGYSN